MQQEEQISIHGLFFDKWSSGLILFDTDFQIVILDISSKAGIAIKWNLFFPFDYLIKFSLSNIIFLVFA